MKMMPPKIKVSYECLSPSPTLPYTIKKKVFDYTKAVKGHGVPEGPLRVLFRFHSDRVRFRFFQ